MQILKDYRNVSSVVTISRQLKAFTAMQPGRLQRSACYSNSITHLLVLHCCSITYLHLALTATVLFTVRAGIQRSKFDSVKFIAAAEVI